MKSLKNILQNSDDYAKILIVVWLKIRDIYLDPYDSSNSSIPSKISLNTRLKKAQKFIKAIKKQCIKLNRCNKLINLLTYLEIELSQGRSFIEKLTQISTIAQMFDIPKPINDLIDILGLNQAEDNDFAKEINNMFDDIDEIDLQKNLTKIDETLNEGTLANFIKNKDKIIDNDIISSLQDSNDILENRNVKLNFGKNKKNEKTKQPEKPKEKNINITQNNPTTKTNITQNIPAPKFIPYPRHQPNSYNPLTPNPRSILRRR